MPFATVLFESNWCSWLFAGRDVHWSLVVDSWNGVAAWGWVLLLITLWAGSLLINWQAVSKLERTPALLISGLRLLSITLLMLIVFQAAVQVSRTSKPVVALVIDTSASMSLIDEYPQETRGFVSELLKRASGKRRIDLVQSLFSPQDDGILSRLGAGHQLDLYLLTNQLEEVNSPEQEKQERGSGFKSLNLMASGKQTDLKGGLIQLLDRYRGSPPSAVVLMTDGNSTAGPQSDCSEGARQLARRGIPLYVVGVGSTLPVRDLEIQEVQTDSVAFVGDRHLFQVHLLATRVNTGKVKVTLTPVGSREPVDSREVTFKNGQARYSVELSHTPDRTGPLDYEVAVTPLTGEMNLQNNKTQVRIWSRESRLKVLLIDRIPRWEYRHVKAVLERDKTIALNAWLQEADAQYSREDRSVLDQLPETLEELDSYDALIWGDVDPDQVPASLLAAVPRFVSSLGGGLVMLAGEKYLPGYGRFPEWRPLLFSSGSEGQGVALESSRLGFQLERTAEGLVHPLLKLDEPGQNTVWSSLPPVYAVLDVSSTPENAQVLLEGVSQEASNRRHPLLVSYRFGTGRVVWQLFDETWRWKAVDHGKPFRRYWSQMVRFLSKSKALEEVPDSMLRSERTTYLVGESARLLLDISGLGELRNQPVIEVKFPDGTIRDIELQPVEGNSDVYDAQIENRMEGNCTATLKNPVLPAGQPAVTWAVNSLDVERTYRPMNLKDLQKSAEMTSGKFLNLWEFRSLESSLPQRSSFTRDRRQMFPLWQRWEIVVLLATTLILEWGLRKRYRLV